MGSKFDKDPQGEPDTESDLEKLSRLLGGLQELSPEVPGRKEIIEILMRDSVLRRAFLDGASLASILARERGEEGKTDE